EFPERGAESQFQALHFGPDFSRVRQAKDDPLRIFATRFILRVVIVGPAPDNVSHFFVATQVSQEIIGCGQTIKKLLISLMTKGKVLARHLAQPLSLFFREIRKKLPSELIDHLEFPVQPPLHGHFSRGNPLEKFEAVGKLKWFLVWCWQR